MAKVEPRNISPLLQILRNFLLGRKHTNALRFADFVAPRTQPPPNLPEGPAHKLSANYYYDRDGRREATPPVLLAENSRLALAAGQQVKAIASGESGKKIPRPGNIWQWD